MNIQINVDQKGLGVLAADFLLKEVKADPAKLLEVRGPAGQPVDAARHEGFHEALAKSGRKVRSREVVGNWAPGDAQKVTADAIAAGGNFDGIYVQGGSPVRRLPPCSMPRKFVVPMWARPRMASA